MRSLYDDDGEESPAEPGPSRPAQDGMKEGSGRAELINAEICPDCQEGDVLMLKVVKHHGEELEVEFMGKEGEGEGGEQPQEAMTESEPSPGQSLMDD